MQFTTTAIKCYLASAMALVLMLAPQAAQGAAGITGFNGNSCQGAAGLHVRCDGSCHEFGGRHSFLVDGGFGDHCVTMFEDAGCPSSAEGRMFTFKSQKGVC